VFARCAIIALLLFDRGHAQPHVQPIRLGLQDGLVDRLGSRQIAMILKASSAPPKVFKGVHGFFFGLRRGDGWSVARVAHFRGHKAYAKYVRQKNGRPKAAVVTSLLLIA
jgi:hypothetical protein